jgi:transposase
MSQQPNFSREFKDQIVELHRQGGRTYMDLAKEFNLSATTVSNWVRAADQRDAKKAARDRADAATGGGESDRDKIRRLEKELARKEQELDILGKALAFFARRADQ